MTTDTQPLTVTAIEYDNTEDWLDIRRHHITGTDVAALMGASPYTTALDVYLNKTIGGGEIPDNDSMRFGRLFESGILAELAFRLNREIVTPKAVFRNEAYPRICGTFDGAVLPDGVPFSLDVSTWEAGAEAKTSRTRWNDGIPPHYLWQVQTYLLVSGLPRWHLIALVGVNDFETFEVLPDPDMHAAIVQVTASFWENVASGTPPEPEWEHPAVLNSVRRQAAAQEAPETPVTLSDEQIAAAREYLTAKAEEEAACKRKDSARARLEYAIGAGSSATAPGLKVSLSRRLRTSYEVPKEVQEKYPVRNSAYTVLTIKEVKE